ncbi:MAG: orotidine-5'-phosphate decarboxylase [Alphaproteobacteria bacterium]|nr:orotidine-5'-phosphate decarboxylase [Alphaproteobacteria bacterium]
MKKKTPLEPKDRLILALDLPSVNDARYLVDKIGETVSIYKIGYRLGYAAGGLELAQQLVEQGKQIFLDFKLHDIPQTVSQGIKSLSRTGASFLTVHAYPQTMRAAIKGRGAGDLTLLAVTALTSYDDTDAAEAGYALNIHDLTARRARQACESGMDGLIIAATEAKDIRAIIAPHIELITPGIRPFGALANDQKQTMTPGEALKAGADRLVIGRPILSANDPKEAAKQIMDEINEALTTA